MSQAKSEEIKLRVPSALKNAVQQIADSRFTSESEIVREAILYYIRHRSSDTLSDAPNLSYAQAEAETVATVATHYGKPKKKPTKKLSK